MPELVASKNEKTFFRIPLSRRRLTIGRSSQNDLTLPDEEISRNHAEILWENETYYLQDLNSTGGVFVDSKKIDKVVLAHKNQIKIGPWQLVFHETSLHDEESEKNIQTCITRLQGESQTKVLKLDPTKETVTLVRPVLIIAEPGTKPRRYALTKKETVIGTLAPSDLILQDDYISGRHCKIERQGNGYLLKDLQSTNGTYLHGNRIQESPLQGGSKITIGKTELILKEEEKEENITPLDTDRLLGLVGKSEVMRSLFSKIQIAAPSDNTVLVHGETGCGKELVAKALHDLSPRNKAPYVVLNCGAISPSLIESELFGHEKGAFTGAFARRLGAFEQAQNGTLFLDEIGELPLELQPKLLRVLENHTIKRVGGDAEIPVNVRVIAATNRLLSSEVKKGKFREDLYFRLYVIPLIIPPLRERVQDIPLLVHHFIRQISLGNPKEISPEAMKKMVDYTWPGNVRELKNTMLRSLLFCQGSTILPKHIEMMETVNDDIAPLNLDQIEKNKILEALRRTNNHKAQAAKMLGIAKSTLFKKLHDYGILSDEKEEK